MSTWADILGQEKKQPYFQQIMQFVESERAAGKTIYPPKQD
ncbi:MAG: uracil-DNA glycosylase, partial [Congregibacter sp.]